MLSRVEAAGLARHTGHITAREVTTLSRRYQPAMIRTATSTWLCTSPTSSPALCRTSSRNSTTGTSLSSLVNPVTRPQRRFLSPFCRRNDECLRSRLLSARSPVLGEVGTSSFTLPTGRFLNNKVYIQ